MVLLYAELSVLITSSSTLILPEFVKPRKGMGTVKRQERFDNTRACWKSCCPGLQKYSKTTRKTNESTVSANQLLFLSPLIPSLSLISMSLFGFMDLSQF